MSASPIVLSVGQCSADDHRLARLLQSHHAAMDRADTADEALSKIAARTYALILVNRILDGDGTPGVDLIAQARAATHSPFMLVSDYPDAQSQARAAGALPGFGKSELHAPQTVELLREALSPRPRHP